MRFDLQEEGDQLAAERPAASKVSVHVGQATLVSQSEATVPLQIVIAGTPPPPSYAEHFTAVALRTHRSWRVSWTTMCLLVEVGGTVCPRTPEGITAGDVLPQPEGSPLAPPDLTRGLIDPGPLAVLPDGSVLIADDARNQILRWKSGQLSVVAGNGLQGFSGDGGPAGEAELDDPGEIAVGPNGTIYFVDGANQRVRAVAIDGVITTLAGTGVVGNTGDGGPATKAAIAPSGLAVGPTGYLWISSGGDIRRVSPDGTIDTEVAGGPPSGDDVTINGVPTAFMPGSLALNGQGSLVVFSFSPKLLFEVSPAGRVTELAQDYATALSTAPNGTVLVAEHGTEISQATSTELTPLINLAPVKVPGLTGPLVAEGVAEAPDGTIYADSQPGDGFTDQTGLYAISGDRIVTPLAVSTPLLATLPGVGASGFPAATYPPTRAASASGLTLASCPSTQGLVPFDRAARSTARHLVGGWNTSFSYDLHASDRAWWTGAVQTFIGGALQGRQTIVSVEPATTDLDASAVEAACGVALVKDSLAIVMGPSPYSGAVVHLFLLDRDGTVLVYDQNV